MSEAILRTEGLTKRFGGLVAVSDVSLDLHVGDVGHTLMVGPTGAGKSVLLATLALQFRRFIGAQVVIFDKGRSARAAALAPRRSRPRPRGRTRARR